ncbi:MAG TPA: DNA translocase FtsK [Acidimicrobiia bacterium]|nr:DNA translocase FtsK [Acidimicrobiia bacterium]
MPSRTSARRKPSRGRAATSRTARRRAAAPRTRRAAPPPRPSVWERHRDEAGRQLAGHRADAAAVALLVLAVLTTLGLVSDAAGAVGSALADGFGAVFGVAKYAVPPVCVVVAVLCFRSGPRSRRNPPCEPETRGPVTAADAAPGAPAEPAPLRVGIGIALLGLATVGVLHLIGGSPSVDTSLDGVRDAGGLLGAAVAEPLSAAAGIVGAAVVLAGLGSLGALLASGVPMRRVVTSLGHGLRRLAGTTRTVPAAGAAEPAGAEAVAGSPAPADRTEPTITLYDVEADLAPESPRASTAPPAPAAPAVVDVPVVDAPPGHQTALDLGSGYHPGDWKLPPPDILKRGNAKGADPRLVQQGGEVLQGALHQHGVDARLVGMTVGPTVTRYELELAPGVKVNRVTSLGHDIAYAMASADVRILAPIPGRSAIGVEVPNKQRQLVTLGDILASREAKAATHPLEVGLGRDIAGRAVMLNLATLPHVLIAGATGAGKSSCINSLVTSLLMRCTPEQVRLILVDPKRVELGAYNDLPHLLTPVVTNPKKAANALDWAVREMDLRYELLAEVGVRDITGYNAMYDRGELPSPDDPDPVTGKGYERLPFIVIVVDELNDLMMVAARDVEASICRIAQMARAVGIHLVIATQRPSVDVITGVIKANVPSRLAFSVSSIADSRVILDQAGAEKLIGQGDLLALTASSSRPQRIQGAWVDEECVRKVAAHWKRQAGGARYVEGVADEAAGSGAKAGGDADEDDDLLVEAMELVVRSGLGSTSMLQRKLRVGFARAGRLMDLLERRGVVGPSEGSKARAVLMTVDELEAMQARAGD